MRREGLEQRGKPVMYIRAYSRSMCSQSEEKRQRNENRIILMGKMRARNSMKMDCVDVFEKAEKIRKRLESLKIITKKEKIHTRFMQ